MEVKVSPSDNLSLEKLKINERLIAIEEYIVDGKKERASLKDTLTQINARCSNVELMIHGDNISHDKNIRDGMHRRLEALEFHNKEFETENKKNKEGLFRWAIGSITIGTGGAVIWLFDIFRQAFTHGR